MHSNQHKKVGPPGRSLRLVAVPVILTALVAFNGKRDVTGADVRAVAVSALRHRLRRDPLDEAGSGMRVERAMAEVAMQ